MGYYSDFDRRREERLSQLKKLGKIQGLKGQNDYYRDQPGSGKIYVKVIVSIIAFIGVYFIFSIQHPIAISSQNFIKEALTREFNFGGVYNMYKEEFTGSPAILPSFAIKEKENATIAFASPIVSLPLQMKEIDNGVLIETNEHETVLAMDKGIVKSINQGEQQGKNLVILHHDGITVEYAYLDTLYVEENDWVEAGQRVGETKNKLFLSLRNNQSYLNPLDVIRFD